MILIINNHSPYIGKLINLVEKNKFKTIVKDQRSPLADIDFKKIKGIILSGGGPNLDEKLDIDEIRADIISLLDFNLPILGICEGHQIIAQVYGGEIESLEQPIERINKIKIIKKTNILRSLPDEVEMEESHGRYVRIIPKDFILAATSEKDKVEALLHKVKPIFSTQFHPESSGLHGEQIIKNFLDICCTAH